MSPRRGRTGLDVYSHSQTVAVANRTADSATLLFILCNSARVPLERKIPPSTRYLSSCLVNGCGLSWSGRIENLRNTGLAVPERQKW